MEFTPSLKLKIMLFLLIAMPVYGFCSLTDTHYFYRSSGIAKLNHENSLYDEAWVNQIGFNYALSPVFKIDIGYSETPSYQDFSIILPPQLLNQLNVTYQGIFGGAKYQRTVFDGASIYAKGGVSITQFDALSSNQSSSESQSRDISSYFSIGATLPAVDYPNLNLNVKFPIRI
ncbi:hypothetical protein P4S72_00400 [Vibrio sp. PP-XX7]